MIKKIQSYLLTHYPLLWNLRIVPMLLILLGAHILLFLIGFIFTDTALSGHRYGYYSSWDTFGIPYFFSVLAAILLFIGWMMMYGRNNGYQILYPKRNQQILGEWCLILVVVAGLIFFPFSITQGYNAKWISATNQQDTEEALDLLHKVEILIPGAGYRQNEYEFDEEYDVPLEGFDGKKSLFYYCGTNKADCMLYLTSPDSVELSAETINKIEAVLKVQNWLREEKVDSIKGLMNAFIALKEKHQLKGNFTTYQWFNRIYHPPYFPVDSTTTIDRDGSAEYLPEDYSNGILPGTLPFDQLERGYEHIAQYYNGENATSNRIAVLIYLSIALIVSIFVFSFRLTSGKQWLIALVTGGILQFIIGLFVAIVGLVDDDFCMLFYFLSWIVLFIVLVCLTVTKVANKETKGKSPIYLNLLLWLVPCLLPLLLFTVSAVAEIRDSSNSIVEDWIEIVAWTNLLLMLPAMAYISSLVRKWKALADE